MAAQQNSTLIYDNVDECPPLLTLPDELKRYSPILPPKTQINQNSHQLHNQRINNKHNINSKNNNNNNKANKNDVKKLREYRKKTTQDRLQQQQRTGSSYGAPSRRSRSISLYGINSTVEQGNKEIPIWVDEETRYVSGVTSRTTCNDIIKALIDDEIRNGNPTYCASQNKYGAASRDCSDYVITESWRGIERSYDGNMAILPVWKAWSRVHNELRLSLKHHKDVPDPNKLYAPTAPIKWYNPLRKYLNKLFKFSKRNHNKTAKQPSTHKGKSQPLSAKDDIPDEILFVILPDRIYDNKADAASNVPHKLNEASGCQSAELLKERLYRLSETRCSTRKRQRARSRSKRKDSKSRERRRTSPSTNNCVQRRRDMPMRQSLRQQLAQKTTEIDDLYQREYALTKELSNKCKLYKLHNELYTKPGQHLELSVGQIQRNIEQYGEEIIKTEHELLELKNEIRQDISIVNNLKRLTLAADAGNDGLASDEREVTESAPPATHKETTDQMQFVDNIYEFCDKNASMLV